MVVAFRHAEPTQTAVFGAGGLSEGARRTMIPRPEEDVVVGIVPKPSGVVRRCDIMGRGCDAEVGEDVRQGQDHRDGQLETEGQVRQAVPDKRASAGAQQGQEDDLQRYEWRDSGRRLDRAERTRTTGFFSKKRYCPSRLLLAVTLPPVTRRSRKWRALGRCRQRARCSQPTGVFLSAGSWPKRATKVSSEMHTTPSTIFFSRFMLI